MEITETKHMYVFKVVLKRRRNIWRKIAIKGDQTLDDLHEAIFRAFDRDEDHLYSFYFPRGAQRGHTWLRDAKEYTHPFAADDPPRTEDESLASAADVSIDALRLKIGQKFHYLFDFGDSWWHEIIVGQIDAAMPECECPRVIESHGKSPAQHPDAADEEF